MSGSLLKKLWPSAAGALVAAGGIGLVYRLLRQPLPQTSGTIKTAGIEGSIEIVRDRYGVPHISAYSQGDLFFGQGFCHAQDRLWQMTFYRRVAAGRLSEFAGAETLDADRLMRTLGLQRVAESELSGIDGELRSILDAYAAGVNAAVEQMSALPVEMQLTKIEHEPWSATETLAVMKIIGLSMSTNWEHELMRHQVVNELGPELANRLDSTYPAHNPVVVSPGEGYSPAGHDLLEQVAAIKQKIGFMPDVAGSNNWVVSGERSQTGKPLLSNDPHLTSSMPCLLYQTHLRCEQLDIDAHGASIAGSPGIFFGQGKWVAWSFTNVAADVQDLFIERLDRDHPSGKVRYEFEGQWRDAEVVEEKIKVKGRAQAVRHEVITTHHGPIINGLLQAEHEPPMALAWTGLRSTSACDVMTKGISARHGKDVLGLFTQFNVPVLNLIWADSDGNIGYHTVGKLPIRRGGVPDLPKPGWTGEYEWDGYVPFDELPSIENPACGFIVTANNRIVDDSYPHHITSEWFDGYRAARIEQLIEATEKHSLDSFAKMHTDVYSIPSVEVVRRLEKLRSNAGNLSREIDLLASWDGHLSADTVAGTIVQAFILELAKELTAAVFKDRPELAERYMSKSATGFLPVNTAPWRFLTRLLELWQENDSSWFDGEDWSSVALRALGSSIARLEGEFGKNRKNWRWGKVHRIHFPHPLGEANPIFKKIFSRDLEGLGSPDTVCQVGYVPTESFTGIWIPAYRLAADLSDYRNSRWQHAGGQSGHIGSKHYDDLMGPWREGQMQSVCLGREEIEALGQSQTLTLVADG